MDADAPAIDEPQPDIFTAADLAAGAPTWLWPGWIPLGRLTVLDGDPGTGKSLLLADLAARVSSTGVMPDGAHGVSGAVLFVSDESLTDTVVPRLQAAGANLSKITLLRSMRTHRQREPLVLPRDLRHIEELLLQTDAKLLILDPFVAFLKGDVTQTLRRLELLAEETGCAIVLARHLAKGKCREPLYRGAGPQAIIASARAALLLARDPEVPERRVLAAYKNTLGPLAPARTFTFAFLPSPRRGGGAGGEGVSDSHSAAPSPPTPLPRRGEGSDAPRLEWGDVSQWEVAQLLAPREAAREQTLLNEACRVLEQETLRGPLEVPKARKMAHELGISDATLRRAKEKLGLRSRRHGFGFNTCWYWHRADDSFFGEQRPNTAPIDEHFGLRFRDRRPGEPLQWPASPEGEAQFRRLQMFEMENQQRHPARSSDLEDELEALLDEPDEEEGGVARDEHLREKPRKKRGWTRRMLDAMRGEGE